MPSKLLPFLKSAREPNWLKLLALLLPLVIGLAAYFAGIWHESSRDKKQALDDTMKAQARQLEAWRKERKDDADALRKERKEDAEALRKERKEDAEARRIEQKQEAEARKHERYEQTYVRRLDVWREVNDRARRLAYPWPTPRPNDYPATPEQGLAMSQEYRQKVDELNDALQEAELLFMENRADVAWLRTQASLVRSKAQRLWGLWARSTQGIPESQDVIFLFRIDSNNLSAGLKSRLFREEFERQRQATPTPIPTPQCEDPHCLEGYKDLPPY